MVELSDNEETTPFSVACENGRIDIVRYLAKAAGLWRKLRVPKDRSIWSDAGRSVDPERPDTDRCTPFFRACLLGRLNVSSQAICHCLCFLGVLFVTDCL